MNCSAATFWRLPCTSTYLKTAIKMKNLVILGGSGLIGSAVAKACSDESDLSYSSISSKDCDLRDLARCGEVLAPLLEHSTIVYAAGIPRLRSNNLDALLHNLTMVHNLIELMSRHQPQRVIFLSSVEVYGAPRQLPIDEQTEIRPHTLYGIGKRAAELMLHSWYDRSDTALAVLRLPGVYGPGDRGRGLIGRLVECVTRGQTFKLFGDGSALRDFVLVDDVARVILALTEGEFDSLTLNVATGQSLSVRDIMEQVFRSHGRCPVEPHPQQQNECDLQFDDSRLSQALPHISMTPLAEGLQRYPIGDE